MKGNVNAQNKTQKLDIFCNHGVICRASVPENYFDGRGN